MSNYDVAWIYALALALLGSVLLWAVCASFVRLAERTQGATPNGRGPAAPKPLPKRLRQSKALAFGLLR